MENIRQAERIQSRIRAQIQDGTFTAADFRRYFPESNNAENGTFGALAQEWISAAEISEATRHEYRKSLNRYWLPELAETHIAELRPSHIKGVVAYFDWPSAKTRNNAIVPLRQILEQAFQDELTHYRLSEYVKSQKHQKPPPDPFSREEADIICDHLRGRHLGNYFEFMFWSGLRPSEALALEWADVDFRNDYVRIQKAQSKGRTLDRTKTATVRDVLLNPRSRGALERQRASSLLAGGRVFLSETGQPYATEKAQRATFTTALKKLGIRHRPQYNTRHTYATMLLMAGANPMFVASQLGHSLQMLLNVYSRWIGGEADKRELDKLNIAPNMDQSAPAKS